MNRAFLALLLVATARPAPGFAPPSTDGTTRRLDGLLGRGPVLPSFIKKGCPRSKAARPFFNASHEAHPGVPRPGVSDRGIDEARGWMRRMHVPHPPMLDPGGGSVRSHEVGNPAGVVLIGRRGEIGKHRPGDSGPMLRELGPSMAEPSIAPIRPLDLADAPEDLSTGCPFESDEDARCNDEANPRRAPPPVRPAEASLPGNHLIDPGRCRSCSESRRPS